MTTGWGARTGRAAVFAAVCVLLTALGHTMMSSASVPWWALGAGAAVTGGAAWLLAGRERGLLPVVGFAVAAQAALHSLFSLAQTLVQPEPSSGSLARQWLDHVLCGAPMDMGSTGMDMSGMDMSSVAMGSMHHGMGSMAAMGPMGSMGSMGHNMGGMSPLGMLLAHLLAAVLSGLWLAYGEQAAFRIARSFAGWLVAPLRLLLRLPTPPHRPRVRARRAESDRAPRSLLLTHTITSRGPPARVAVA
ncbi:hypothetical protein ACFRAO_32670 [Streptomyces sp. NPDC056656]|uniref:hypothetical protein n=1 Tax=Streptomyces sp. NPDC056656 TaxID=3345895 RepID=UPI0036850346